MKTLKGRLLPTSLLAAWVSMVVACGGGGKRAETPQTEVDNKPSTPTKVGSLPPKTASAQEEARYEAIIKEATTSREEAIARREQVQARNGAKNRQYELELEAFEEAKTAYEEKLKAFTKELEAIVKAFTTAKTEYDSLRALDFAKNFKTELALTKAYRDIIHDFPGTDAAKESQRRLTGGASKSLPVPPIPIAIKRPIAPKRPVAPAQPQYEPDPAIPEVPTLAALRERDLATERQRKEEATAEATRKKQEAAAEATR